jgi:acyl carrier protein
MILEERIAAIVIDRLELEGYTPASFPKDAPLFASKPGGFGLDSLAALEIMAGLSEVLDHPFPDVEREDLASIAALTAYVRRIQGDDA